MRFRFVAALAAFVGLSFGTSLFAQDDEPVSGTIVCTMGRTISEPFDIPSGATRDDLSRVWDQWQDYTDSWTGGSCSMGTSGEMDAEFDKLRSQIDSALGTPNVVDFRPEWRPRTVSNTITNDAKTREEASKPKAAGTLAREEEAKREADQLARERREAEWQAELAKYEADKRAWEAEVARQQEEERRKQAAFEEAQRRAEQELARFEREQTMFERVVEEQERRQRLYELELERNRRCRDGDRQACEDIRSGKPVPDEELADAGEASTDTDARRCVSAPVVGPDPAFRGSTRATIVNGCERAVDVRICLLRTGGWNCAVQWGLKPQESWSQTSFEFQDDVFWDARISESDRPLASPPGS